MSYLAEKFTKNDSFLIFKNKHLLTQDGSKIITTKIQSRHTSSKQYRVYIRYLPISETIIERPDHIKSWFCECKNGARTLGCCCHIAALLYYLAYARHLKYQSLKKPAFFLNSIFPRDLPQSEENSDKSSNLVKSKQQKRTKKSTQLYVSSSDSDDYKNDYDQSENESFDNHKFIKTQVTKLNSSDLVNPCNK